jgi:hypothetical protein
MTEWPYADECTPNSTLGQALQRWDDLSERSQGRHRHWQDLQRQIEADRRVLQSRLDTDDDAILRRLIARERIAQLEESVDTARRDAGFAADAYRQVQGQGEALRARRSRLLAALRGEWPLMDEATMMHAILRAELLKEFEKLTGLTALPEEVHALPRR